MKTTFRIGAALVAAVCLTVSAGAADLTDLTGSMVSAKSFTNGIGRTFAVDGIYLDASDTGTAQTITLSVIAGGVTYGALDTFAVTSGQANYTADSLILVPADAILTLTSDQAAITNQVRVFRSEPSLRARYTVLGSLPSGSVTATEIATGAVGTSEIATGAIVNEDINASAAIVATKLASAVQTSLGLADTSLQPNAVTETNVVITADSKTNTIITVGGQITSWETTE